MDVKEYIVEYLEREYHLPEGIDPDSLNFVETGYVDSMGMIQFIALLEDEFGIEFSDEELLEPAFRTVRGLTAIIEKKLGRA